MGKWASLLALLTSLHLFSVIHADTPANCTFQDVAGKWTLYESTRNMNKHENCTTMGGVVRKIKIDLQYPNIAVDEFGNYGIWTMVYNEGFEVTINERTYFAFSMWTQEGGNVTSICDSTFPGWSHDVTLRHWACFYGKKQRTVAAKRHRHPFHQLALESSGPSPHHFERLVEEVNRKQTQWRAEVHTPFLHLTHHQLLQYRGGQLAWLAQRPAPAPVTPEQRAKVSGLPRAFDWRDVDGADFVSPVRNQGVCGSCYAFSSVGMLEARVRVRTNNTQTPTLAPQDVVSCSELAQGCSGGFPFLIAGRYAKDFGIPPEQCNPYQGHDGPCSRDTCVRQFTARYGYVGGYYGACNEALMQLALMGGPISVSFQVHSDFMAYKGGIYHYTGVHSPGFNPFVAVNHAVLLVGWGEDAGGEKFWIVKNSWGQEWGEGGFFRIRRGVDECGIESIAVYADPIP